jgi:hypothetical protein
VVQQVIPKKPLTSHPQHDSVIAHNVYKKYSRFNLHSLKGLGGKEMTELRAYLLRRLNSEGGTPIGASEVGELILSMRRDLGFERTRLSASDFDPLAK